MVQHIISHKLSLAYNISEHSINSCKDNSPNLSVRVLTLVALDVCLRHMTAAQLYIVAISGILFIGLGLEQDQF